MNDLRQPRLTVTADVLARYHRIRWIAIGVAYLVTMMIVLNFDILVPLGDVVQYEVGDVPTEAIYAPNTISYESTVLTDQARNTARQETPPIYDRQFEKIGEHLKIAEDIVRYMNLVRNDNFASNDQRIEDLQAIELLNSIEAETWEDLITANNNRWDTVTRAIVPVLTEVMSIEIRPPDGPENARRSLTNIVNPSINFIDRRIITEIVGALIIPNSVLNEQRTREEQEKAANAVQPVIKNYRRGETIVNKGERIDQADIEALRQFGLLQSEDSSRILFSSFLTLIIVSFSQLLYVYRFYPKVYESNTMMILLPALMLIFLAGARAFGPTGFDNQRIYPAAAMGFLITALVGPHLATISVAGLALLMGTMFDNSLEVILLVAIGGIVGSIALRDIESLNSYFSAGFFVGLTNMLVVLSFIVDSNETSSAWVASSEMFIAFASGLLSAGVALVGLYIIGSTANLPTNIKLIELMQPNHPLLQELLRKAPGTYQHSLQVANLAELATEKIGANAALVRVAAMYHDIGKTLNPHFFVENQTEGFNPHDELGDPHRSAQLIIGHVLEGERLARRHRLPQRIRDFIREHHGTTKPMYFYIKALERVDGNEAKLREADFTYPGPIPQTKETAILMLADGAESTARAIRPRTHEAVEDVVDKIFKAALENGQLDESNLTLNELKTIRSVFIETLQAIYHPRIAYPTRPAVRADAVPPAQLQQPQVAEAKIADKRADQARPASVKDADIIIEGETIDDLPVSDANPKGDDASALKVKPSYKKPVEKTQTKRNGTPAQANPTDTNSKQPDPKPKKPPAENEETYSDQS